MDLPDCTHDNMEWEADGEFYKEHCPDCSYSHERDDMESERLTVRGVFSWTQFYIVSNKLF